MQEKKKHFIIFEDYAKNSQTENARLENVHAKKASAKNSYADTESNYFHVSMCINNILIF